jgi:hypothetical protein
MNKSGKQLVCAAVLVVAAALVWSTISFAAEAEQENLPVGTVIDMKNWQNYKQYMPPGMQAMFKGTYFWKFPPDFQIVIGPTHHVLPPTSFQEYTEKYASQVKIVDLPDGRHTISGYVSGWPFPTPAEPQMGLKILIDNWFAYVPYLICGNTYSGFEDRFGNVYREMATFIYRRLSHIGDPGQPLNDPQAQGMDYSEYVMVNFPEQAKYTTDLTIYYTDYTKPENTFLFIPALRRSLRLSTAARCTPFIGSDLILDDPRVNGFNGGFARFDAKMVTEQKILGDLEENVDIVDKWNNFYQPVFFAKPGVGKFELRDTWVIDVRRIPSQRSGYCYGKRLMWIDKETKMSFWQDIYDSSMKFWKMNVWPVVITKVPGQGPAITPNGWANQWDIQNDHLSFWAFKTPDGLSTGDNADCRNRYGENMDDVGKYSTAAGLATVLR